MKTTRIKIIKPNGDVGDFCSFLNEMHPMQNLVTTWMMVHNIGNILDKKMQLKAYKAIKISKSGQTAMFKYGEDVYITRI